MPCRRVPLEVVQHDLVERLLAGQHRRQQDAVVVRMRLGAEHRDVVAVRARASAAPRACARPPCRCRPPPALLVPCGVHAQPIVQPSRHAALFDVRLPAIQELEHLRVAQLRCSARSVASVERGRAAAAGRPRGSRRSSPPGRWSSSRCGRTSSTASSTSCVTITHRAAGGARRSSCSSSCSCARVSASSAPNGSSRSSTFGSIASARAMPTRCFMPPEISCGILVLRRASRPHQRERLVRALASSSAFGSVAAEHALDREMDVARST